MSIFFEFEVGPTGRRFRRAVDDDVKAIECFSSGDKCLFGDVDIGSLIELSVLSICMVNEENEVTGFLAVSHFPNVPGVDPSNWEFWIRNMYQRYYLPRNTLFIHFMSCVAEVSVYFLDEALKSVFMNDSYLTNIVLVVPPDCPMTYFEKYQTFRRKNFYRYYGVVRPEPGFRAQYLCVATRNEFLSRLKIRRAVEEDNDDIVKILDKKSTRFKDLYGNYYISELIGIHASPNRKLLVAEFQEKAVGIMCLNTDINYNRLQEQYELNPFYGLRAATNVEKERIKRTNELLQYFGDPIMRGKWSPFSAMEKLKIPKKVKHKKPKRKTEQTQIAHGKINFKTSSENHIDNISTYSHENSGDSEIIGSPTRLSGYSDRSALPVALLEADPFEYEIVNIATSLLSVPPQLSVEALDTYNSVASAYAPLKEVPIEDDKTSKYIIDTKPSLRNVVKKSVPKVTLKNTSENFQINLEGHPNAFAVELLALREDFDDREDFSLLEASFETIPEMEYCIILKPCTETNFSLLQHFCYVPARRGVHSEYSLYVAHRSSIRGKFRVRKAEIIDIPQIAQLLNSLDAKETLWTLEHTVMTDLDHHVFVLLTGLTVIGVAIVESPEQLDYIRLRYNMDFFHNHKYHDKDNDTNKGFGAIKTVIVHPAFEVHFRFFAREIMRLSSCNSLLWLTTYRNKWVIKKANSVAPVMVPLTPRMSEIDCIPNMGRNRKKQCSKSVIKFATWFINNKITSIPRINIDVKILIIGASRTSMGFLNALLFSDAASYLTFTDVTLVSPDGLPYLKKSTKEIEIMFQKYRTSTDRFMKCTPYTYYVNVIHGKMMEIDKKNKFITLENGQICHYNYLLLLFGKQYQYPSYTEALKNKQIQTLNKDGSNYTRLDIPRFSSSETELFTFEKPENVFVINNVHDAQKSINYINKVLKLGGNIVVYGSTIEAYCCLTTLLEMKIPPKQIIFVEPFPSDDELESNVSVFANEYVDQTIREMLKKLDVTKYESYFFQSWTNSYDNFVTDLEFASYYNLIKIECSAFFYYGIKGVDLDSFTAINASGMAYDGGIVIDGNFQTKDSSIYAAGPVTRYSRHYFATTKRHRYYDSYEVGDKLGHLLRNKLDPIGRKTSTKQFWNDNNNGNICSVKSPLPSLKKPFVCHCILPGSLQYLDVRSPGRKNSHHFLQNTTFNGHVIETFQNGYFKLHLNSNLIVDSVTCLTSDDTSLDNFKNIYGRSTYSLRNIHILYGTKRLTNLFKFFRSPWAFYLYHDHTEEFLAMTREVLPLDGTERKTMREVLEDIARKYPEDCSESKAKIRSDFQKSPYIEAITHYVIQWISENQLALPIYLKPWQYVDFVYDNEHNPYFRKKSSVKNMLKKMF